MAILRREADGIYQSSRPVENDVTARSLGYDQTVYLFGARSEVSVGGFELVYQTVTQIAGL